MISQQPFRLLDLPAEIRNRIYKEILCAFAPATPELSPLARILQNEPELTDIKTIPHSIETTILRACKQVHREAYDVMVKTNCFIRIQSNTISIAGFLALDQIPVITMDTTRTAEFRGYVMCFGLHDDIKTPLNDTVESVDFMILGRDWKDFCNYFTYSDMYYLRWHNLLIFQHGMVDLPDYKAPLGKPFLEKTQNYLLEPFRTKARELQNVEIIGLVSPSVSQSVIAEVKSESWPDVSKLISAMEDAHNQATSLFEAGKILEASSTWQQMLALCDRLVEKTIIHRLKLNKEIRNAAYGIKFKGHANMASCYLHYLRNPPPGLSKEFTLRMGHSTRHWFSTAENIVHSSIEWSPPPAAVVKLLCEACECRRLIIQLDRSWQCSSWKQLVGRMLVQAYDLAPEDPQVQWEAENYQEWAADVDESWEPSEHDAFNSGSEDE